MGLSICGWVSGNIVLIEETLTFAASLVEPDGVAYAKREDFHERVLGENGSISESFIFTRVVTDPPVGIMLVSLDIEHSALVSTQEELGFRHSTSVYQSSSALIEYSLAHSLRFRANGDLSLGTSVFFVDNTPFIALRLWDLSDGILIWESAPDSPEGLQSNEMFDLSVNNVGEGLHFYDLSLNQPIEDHEFLFEMELNRRSLGNASLDYGEIEMGLSSTSLAAVPEASTHAYLVGLVVSFVFLGGGQRFRRCRHKRW